MSIRRKEGDWVWLKANCGFTSASNLLKAEIMGDDHGCLSPCFGINGCDDKDCKEWSTLWTEPDQNGERHMLCHVSECEMFDEPQK